MLEAQPQSRRRWWWRESHGGKCRRNHSSSPWRHPAFCPDPFGRWETNPYCFIASTALIGREERKASHHFRHAPRLCGASARMVGWLAVEDLADRADAGVAEVLAERGEEAESGLGVVRMDAQPGV